MRKIKSETGEVMIEGIIIMVITMLVLIWILAIGFVYYQKYLVTAVTNDAAAKIAATYNNPDSDIIMGYIEVENLAERDLYRNFTSNSLVEVNQDKAEAYITYMLKKTNFGGTVKNVTAELKMVRDSAFRKHVEIQAICTFDTPFGEALELFGMSKEVSYSTIGRADCTDIIDYISSVDCMSYQLSGNGVSGKIVKMINSIIGLFNHRYEKT